jgi:hypothetical protein
MSKTSAILAALLLLAPACRKESKARVECKSTGATLDSGMTCTIEHQQGDEPLRVCWAMSVACRNGERGKARGCGDVRPMGTSMVALPFSAFGGALDGCDAVDRASVGDMSIAAAD